MAITLSQLKEKYPEYSKMPDDVLADKLYNKYYSTMPREKFDTAVGFTPLSPAVKAINDYVIDPVNALGAGMARTIAGTAGLPGTAYDYVRGKIDPKYDASKNPYNIQNVTKAAGSLMDAGNAALGYKDAPDIYYTGEPDTFAHTMGRIGEFAVPLPMGKTKLVADVLGPAAGSLLADKAVEKGYVPDWAEPYAPFLGAVVGGVTARKGDNMLRSAISPGGGADPVRLAEIKRLRRLGVPFSAGQATENAGILAAEADTALGQKMFGTPFRGPNVQGEKYTTAIMQHLGSDAPLATPEALREAKAKIVQSMDESVAGVIAHPTLGTLTDVQKAAKYFVDNAPSDEHIGKLFSNIMSRLSQGQPIPAENLVSWRSNLGDHLFSDNAGVRGIAFQLRGIIDDMIENSLHASGEPWRFDNWVQSRDQYRTYLAARDAIKPTTESGMNGVITPKQLMQSLAKQDKDAIVTGRRGEIGELAYLGLRNMQPLPQSGRGSFLQEAAKATGPLAAAGAAGLGAFQAANFAGLSPLITGLGTAAAMAVPVANSVKQAMRTSAMNPVVQKYLGNQLLNPTNGVSLVGSALKPAIKALPSAIVGRKSGGRVSSSHDMAADQLVRAAERAKKGWSEETEPLLNQSDDAIAHALEVANRSI